MSEVVYDSLTSMAQAVIDAQNNTTSEIMGTSLDAAAPIKCIGCGIELCTVCGRCEEVACYLYGRMVTSKSELVQLRHLAARTQKARGYVAIADVLNVPSPFNVIMDANDIESVIQRNAYVHSGMPLFVRPCPVRPRHGFVESRKVNTSGRSPADLVKEIHAIFLEAQKADPEAELLIVPAISASHNVILTPTKMAIGIGNDGATAGKKSTLFPLLGVPFKELSPAVIEKAGVDVRDFDPYIEVVIKDSASKAFYEHGVHSDIFCTQLRAGVRISPAIDKDFIPARIQVEKVIEASGDLLEWEKQVQEINTPGTVVFHMGGTLISHYGVHCIFHNIPILTTRKPEVGEVLFPTARPSLPSAESIIRGFGIGASDYIGLVQSHVEDASVQGAVKISCSQAVALLLTCAHNAPAMGGDHGYWIGIATALMLRLGMAASHGEARHRDPHSLSLRRDYVYDLALNDFFTSRDTLGYAQWRFTYLRWDGSFGGKKWAKCTQSIIMLDNAAKRLMDAPTEGTVADLITALHTSINQAHNGGWWLDKFVNAHIFESSCTQSIYSLSTAAPAILQIAGSEIPPDAITAAVEKWKAAPVIKVENPVPELPTKLYPKSDSDDDSDDDDNGDDDDPESVADLDNLDPPELGCDCPECTAKKVAKDLSKLPEPKEPLPTAPPAMNITGATAFPETAKIISAQAQVSLTNVHIQFKTEGMSPGQYVSFNAKFQKPLTAEQLNQIYAKPPLPSYSGSGAKYFPIEPVQVWMHPEKWIFYFLHNGSWKSGPWIMWDIVHWQVTDSDQYASVPAEGHKS